MPVRESGLLFRYFDKAICVIVAGLLLVALFYAVTRTSGIEKGVDKEEIAREIKQIKERSHKEPPAIEELKLVDKVRPRTKEISEARAVRDPMVVPLPVVYEPQKVATNMKFVLHFSAPLDHETIHKEGDEFLVTIGQHPVAGDYSKVELESSLWPGEIYIVGKSGKDMHVYPVIIGSSAGKTPYRPIELTVRQSLGSVLLAFKPDPKVKAQRVKVKHYEIWRRDWDDPLGNFKQVATVKPGSTSSAGGEEPKQAGPLAPRGPRLPGLGESGLSEFQRRLMQARGRTAPPGPEATGGKEETKQEKDVITWRDSSSTVKPGSKYAYKVRLVGANTYPTEGEFTDPVSATVGAPLDIRFTLTGANNVRFEVVKEINGEAQKDSFWVCEGDEIGGLKVKPGKGNVNLASGYRLVDFHPQVRDPETGARTSRVIYADQKGVLHAIYRNQKTLDYLWKKAAVPSYGGR
ncbi:MAG: hypothetical protein J7M08_05235 [Planctomycetes bacterium]|nr:hypothetical protein [Planctomycetota bacterium]